MASIAGAALGPWQSLGLRDDDDSTSGQFGDISSQHSALEEVHDGREEDEQGLAVDAAKCIRAQRHRDDKRTRDQQTDGEDERCTTYREGESRVASQETLPEVYELEDGGYDADAEVQYPDGVEEPDSGDENMGASILTAEGSRTDPDALTEKLRHLRVKGAEGRASDEAAAAVFKEDNSRQVHKRSHSESVESLSENSQRTADAASSPAQKRARIHAGHRRRNVERIEDGEAMDIT